MTPNSAIFFFETCEILYVSIYEFAQVHIHVPRSLSLLYWVERKVISSELLKRNVFKNSFFKKKQKTPSKEKQHEDSTVGTFLSTPQKMNVISLQWVKFYTNFCVFMRRMYNTDAFQVAITTVKVETTKKAESLHFIASLCDQICETLWARGKIAFIIEN